MVLPSFYLQSLQSDLEAEQVKVNSLTHMVVIVDENSGESATAVLEDQLQVNIIGKSTGFWGLEPTDMISLVFLPCYARVA